MRAQIGQDDEGSHRPVLGTQAKNKLRAGTETKPEELPYYPTVATSPESVQISSGWWKLVGGKRKELFD